MTSIPDRRTRRCCRCLCFAVVFGNPVSAQPPARARINIEAMGPQFYTPATKRAVDGGLAYLAARQKEDGSFSDGQFRGNVAVTALCGLAFLAGGHTPGRGKYGQNVTDAVSFLLKRTQPNGYIVDEDVRYHGPLYGHGFATLFLAEVYGMTANRKMRKELRTKLKRAVELIIRSQKTMRVNVDGVNVDGGGWRYLISKDEADVSVTVCQVMALRAARNCGISVPKKTIDLSVNYVKACQNRKDGGFRYQTTQQSPSVFPRSAAAVVALYSAGIYKGRVVTDGLKFVNRSIPQGRARKIIHYYYGHYYAAQAMWHAGGHYWKDWYPAIRDELVAEQHEDSYWPESAVCKEYGTAMACLVLQTPMNYLPIFQR